jgi:hypothetical protein
MYTGENRPMTAAEGWIRNAVSEQSLKLVIVFKEASNKILYTAKISCCIFPKKISQIIKRQRYMRGGGLPGLSANE